MLKRSQASGNKFDLMPGGKDGRAILSQPPPRIVADFPWGDEKVAAAHLLLNRDLAELDQSLTLVVLCDHLLPRAADYRALEEALRVVSEKFLASPEVQERRWPRLKFMLAPGPTSEVAWRRLSTAHFQTTKLAERVAGLSSGVLVIP